jgi:antitoxin YefM
VVASLIRTHTFTSPGLDPGVFFGGVEKDAPVGPGQGEGVGSIRLRALGLMYFNAYNTIMRTTSYSELRKNLASALDKVVEDREPVIITRDRGKPAAVLMSLEEFTSWEETLHLLSSQANAARLMDATKALDSDAVKAGFRLSPE